MAVPAIPAWICFVVESDFSYSSVIASHLIWLSEFMVITIQGASALAPVFTYT